MLDGRKPTTARNDKIDKWFPVNALPSHSLAHHRAELSCREEAPAEPLDPLRVHTNGWQIVLLVVASSLSAVCHDPAWDEPRGKPDQSRDDQEVIKLSQPWHEIGDKVYGRSQIDEGCPKKPL